MTPEAQKQRLSVEQWCDYARAGVPVPVVTRLHGISMEPLIRYKKDPVTVIPVNRPLLLGDVVLFLRQDGAYVVHRLYRLSEDGETAQTWGDNCVFPDRPIRTGDILGLVVCVERNGKKIRLDTEQQRQNGIRWMNNSPKRRAWVLYRTLRSVPGRALRRAKRKILSARKASSPNV